MSMALLLTMLLPVLQDDPQVTYREGLFEEVDQGNLEKAAELYGKILKSGAPDALKAKALLRTGFCHEKKGKKKEAEQAWRDVIERYPDAADTVKLARERLSRTDNGPSSKSMEDQIQREIFNLGSVDDQVRIEARRMLLYIGEPAVASLHKALQNRDRNVSGGAARVLYELEIRDGLYDALRRFWISKGDLSDDDVELLPRLLKEREADRKKFLKDAAVLMNSPSMVPLASTLCGMPEPEFSRIVEDWIVVAAASDAGNAVDMVMDAWMEARESTDVARVMQRLASIDPPATGTILQLFYRHAARAKAPDAALKKACLEALQAAPPGTDYFDNLRTLSPFIPIQELVRGPVSVWLAKRTVEDRRRLLENIANLSDMEERERALLSECRKYLFEQLAASDVPLETKELILASGFNADTPEERAKFLAYCLHYWKEQGANGQRKSDALMGVLGHLAYHLPPDAKELPAILDAAFDVGASYPGMWGERPEERRPLVIAAMHRSLDRNDTTRELVLNNFSQYGSPEEHLSIGPLLGKLGPTRVGYLAGYTYAKGFHALDPSALEGRWKEVAGHFEAGTQVVKNGMVQALAGMNYGPVDDLMKKELASPMIAIRQGAIRHWGERRGPEAMKQLSLALQDRYEPNQKMAMNYLRATPSLEVVPELIKLLNSPSKEVRDIAGSTLVEYKQHFAAQAEWQRWYDETKKTLGK